MSPLITVVVPTIAGREDHYKRCVDAYAARSVYRLQLVTVRDLPTCGEAWNVGAEQAEGDFLHFSADDLEPHEGWDVAAVEAVGNGHLPAPRILNPGRSVDYCGEHGLDLPDGTVVGMSVIPFMSRAMWDAIGPVLPIHYYSDNWISYRAGLAGFKTVVYRRFEFTHHWAQPGRGAGMSYSQRMAFDRARYVAEVRAAGP